MNLILARFASMKIVMIWCAVSFCFVVIVVVNVGFVSAFSGFPNVLMLCLIREIHGIILCHLPSRRRCF